jgi:hypothetical protein
VLIMLATMSPWALLRLVPLAEIATGAAGAFRGEMRSATDSANTAVGYANDWVNVTTASMKRDAQYRMADADVPPRFAGGSDQGGGLGGGGSDLGGDDGPPDPGGGDSPEPTPPAPQPPPAREVPWSEQTPVELGPGIVNARVWPHEDADEQ